MREYDSAGIRNIAVVGHGGSGKTSLVDALCFAAGSGRRHGTVRDGTALTDHLPEEIERGYSIALGCAYAEWMEAKINFIDTPGSLDFQGEALAGLAAADGALCVIGGASGVEVGTERVFRAAVARQDPVLFVVSMMDKELADFDRVDEQLKARLTTKVVPVEIPIGAGANFRGVINLFTQRAYMYTSGGKGEFVEADVPAECAERFARYRQDLIEAISATDDALLERYLDGGDIDRDRALHGMKDAMARLDLFPLFCASSDSMIGVRALLTELVQLMPNAYEMEEMHALTGAECHQTIRLHAKDDLSGRRGHILGTESTGDRSVVRAVVPQSELHLYATQLFSLTHGHGQFVRRFNGYEQVPNDAAQKIVAEAAKEKEAAEA